MEVKKINNLLKIGNYCFVFKKISGFCITQYKDGHQLIILIDGMKIEFSSKDFEFLNKVYKKIIEIYESNTGENKWIKNIKVSNNK